MKTVEQLVAEIERNRVRLLELEQKANRLEGKLKRENRRFEKLLLDVENYLDREVPDVEGALEVVREEQGI